MNIVLYPDNPLCDVASRVETFGPDLAHLAEKMAETMMRNDGVGLAGPQVGVSRQIIVFCEPGSEPVCLVNPEIVESEGKGYQEEGCLSLPGIYAAVPRATRIRVKVQDCDGKRHDFEAHDFLARIIQHECDHLQGKVFPDRLDILTRDALLSEWSGLRNQAVGNPTTGR